MPRLPTATPNVASRLPKACCLLVEGINFSSVNPLKAAPKKLVAKASTKPRPAAKAKPRRQMTVALAEKRALGWADGRKIDSVAFLRALR